MIVPVIPTVVLTGVVVTAGYWADNKLLNIRIAVGLTVYAIALSYLDNFSPELASMFAALVLVAAVWTYTPTITSHLKGIK